LTQNGNLPSTNWQPLRLPAVNLAALIDRALDNEGKPEESDPEDDSEELAPDAASESLTAGKSLASTPNESLPSSLPTRKKPSSSSFPISVHTYKKRKEPEDKIPTYRSQKRTRRRARNYAKNGHIGGYNSSVGVTSAMPMKTTLSLEALPSAFGGYVAVEQDVKGRTVDRPLEWFLAQGFELKEWDGRYVTLSLSTFIFAQNHL
jgi:hypothetical protein